MYSGTQHRSCRLKRTLEAASITWSSYFFCSVAVHVVGLEVAGVVGTARVMSITWGEGAAVVVVVDDDVADRT